MLFAVAVLSVVGIAVSSVSQYEHYDTGKSSFCDLDQTFNCDLVNRSAYSEVEGVPVAFVGIVGYAVLLALATLRRKRPETPLILLISSGVGLAFALYLTYIEKFILAMWCVLCLSSLGVIAGIVLLSAGLVAWRAFSPSK